VQTTFGVIDAAIIVSSLMAIALMATVIRPVPGEASTWR
jgi:hypothetical protein